MKVKPFPETHLPAASWFCLQTSSEWKKKERDRRWCYITSDHPCEDWMSWTEEWSEQLVLCCFLKRERERKKKNNKRSAQKGEEPGEGGSIFTFHKTISVNSKVLSLNVMFNLSIWQIHKMMLPLKPDLTAQISTTQMLNWRENLANHVILHVTLKSLWLSVN